MDGEGNLISEEDIAAAQAFVLGEVDPIATARALCYLLPEDHPPELYDALTTFMLVDSETDDVPIGALRDEWHPSVREKEDAKHDKAMAWAQPLMAKACTDLLRFAGANPPPSLTQTHS